MKAIEFKSKVKNNQIQIPVGVQSEFNTNKGKDIRVIVLFDDADVYDELLFMEISQKQFLQGYSESDSVYDNC